MSAHTLPVALMGVSCAQRKREALTMKLFKGNKQKELKNVKIGLYMKY